MKLHLSLSHIVGLEKETQTICCPGPVMSQLDICRSYMRFNSAEQSGGESHSGIEDP
jgi:hypothetical protein